jgi:hypothetical protein
MAGRPVALPPRCRGSTKKQRPAAELTFCRCEQCCGPVPQPGRVVRGSGASTDAASEDEPGSERDYLDVRTCVRSLDDLSIADVHGHVLARVSRENQVAWF